MGYPYNAGIKSKMIQSSTQQLFCKGTWTTIARYQDSIKKLIIIPYHITLRHIAFWLLITSFSADHNHLLISHFMEYNCSCTPLLNQPRYNHFNLHMPNYTGLFCVNSTLKNKCKFCVFAMFYMLVINKNAKKLQE